MGRDQRNRLDMELTMPVAGLVLPGDSERELGDFEAAMGLMGGRR